MTDVKVILFKCLTATIPLTCTLANEYPSSNEISKKNGTLRGDCIACDALLTYVFCCPLDFKITTYIGFNLFSVFIEAYFWRTWYVK